MMQKVNRDDDSSPSQTLRAVLGVRGLIIDGELKGGDRVAEPLVVERFGVSRTPARTALAQLKEEGLLQTLPSGGYVTSTFTERDVFDAIELRGTLEGLAARFAAERGAPKSLLSAMQECVDELDAAVEEFAETYDPSYYVRLNDRFHQLLVQAGQSQMVERSLQRVLSLPFAAPNAFVRSTRTQIHGAIRINRAAQEQHRSIVEAIRNREGKRAEALTCEHSRSAWNYLRMALESDSVQFPGRSLVRRAG
jgi:GntR family transcriptional regulator, vanillate catabolism transcriptional regulator